MTQAKKQNIDINHELWVLKGSRLKGLEEGVKGSLFALGNGYIGTRGTEEIRSENADSDEGTYLNGAFYREKITYGESAYGFATHNNKILRVADGKKIVFESQGELFSPDLLVIEKALDEALEPLAQLNLAEAVLSHQYLLQTASGKQLSVSTRRFVSQAEKNLMVVQYQLVALNFSGVIKIHTLLDVNFDSSEIDSNKSEDPREGVFSGRDFMQEHERYTASDLSYFIHEIIDPQSLVCVAAVCDSDSTLTFCAEEETLVKQNAQADQLKTTYQLELQQGVSSNIDKYLFYGNEFYGNEFHGSELNGSELNSSELNEKQNLDVEQVRNKLLEQARVLLNKCCQKGFSTLYSEHLALMQRFWQNSDITINNSPVDQIAIRLNLLHLHMSAGKDGHSNIAAKGLSGAGYDGHYFWDSEIYVMPLFIYTAPDVAKNLLMFRHNTLPQARTRARQLSIETGALFPWRTIGGEECSAFFLAGTAQYHINAAIGYAVRHYFEVTNDWNFMCEYGAELVFETARIWPEIGHFSETHGGLFCIDQVTGPDEYTALVNNNFYTNSMAQLHLEFAVKIAVSFQRICAKEFLRLCDKIKLDQKEIIQWQVISDKMYIPFDETRGINPQDDSFLDKKAWDFVNVPEDKYPLLLNFHPLVIYRHQVLKQADVVLAMNLLDNRVSKATKSANLDFYEPLTTHDSTLSACAHCIAYCEVGDYVTAFDYFEKTLLTDLQDLHHNSCYGVHTASMGGAWMCIVQGFAGLRVRDGELYFIPHLPLKYTQLKFRIQIRENRLEVVMNPSHTDYRLITGSELVLYDNGQRFKLDKIRRDACIQRNQIVG